VGPDVNGEPGIRLAAIGPDAGGVPDNFEDNLERINAYLMCWMRDKNPRRTAPKASGSRGALSRLSGRWPDHRSAARRTHAL